MSKIGEYINDYRERERKYLIDGKRSIAKDNIQALSIISVGSVILAAICVLCTYLLNMRVPSGSQFMLIPAMAVFAVISTVYGQKGKINPRVVQIMSLAYEITVFIFIILIDVVQCVIPVESMSEMAVSNQAFIEVDGYVAYPAIYMPIVITALSAGLFFSTKLTNILNVSFTAVYIIFDLFIKVEEEWAWVRNYDICVAIIGLCFATLVSAHCHRTKVVEYTSKMKYKSLSMRDPLLEEIYNKRGYEDAIENYLASNNPNVNCAFIVLDLNDFKHINDNYGHDMGDNILRCMSDTLVSLFRDSDIIGRFGGDEFIVLADGLSDADAVEKKCRYIAELIGRRAQETGAIKVFSSLGAVICDNQSVDFERLFQIADEAMYNAKEMGRSADRFVLRHYSDSAE